MDSIITPKMLWLTATACVVVLLYNISQWFNFYCKLLMFNAFMVITSAVVIPLAMFRPGNVRNTILAGIVFRFLCSVFGIRWIINGREHLEGKEPCVVICNHQSSVDVLGMMELWPYLNRCVPMIKKELRYFSGPFGILAALSGSVFIDRFNPEKARDTVNTTVNYLREKNTKLWVFPEGTRNAGGDMLPFKKGAFHIAVQGKLPILPIVFSSYSQHYNKKKKIFQGGTVTVTALPPISTSDLEAGDVGQLTERLRSLMLDTFYQTSDIERPTKDNVKNGSS